MALEKINQVKGRGVTVAGDDIDTDQIIPARFLLCVTFDALGAQLFQDARFEENGDRKDHPLNDPRFEGASLMLSGKNFGCGSSREHAPQSLSKAGFKAVIAESFAEIFFGNSTTLGIPCVTLSRDEIAQISAAIETDPATEVGIDLEKLEVRAGTLCFSCAIRDSARDALVRGEWDPISQLLDARDEVAAVHDKLPYTRW